MNHPFRNSELKERLIILEENFLTSILSDQAFTQLQNIYSLLIAYYDEIEDPIRDYFLEKNNYIIARKQDYLNTILKQESFKNGSILAEPDSPIQSSLVCLKTHKELRFKKIKFTQKVEEWKQDERDSSIEILLNRHLTEKNRLTEFIKKEQTTQEMNFHTKLDAIRERRIEYSINELSKTVASVKEHLIGRRPQRSNIAILESNKILDLSGDVSGESGRSCDEIEKNQIADYH